MMSLLKAIFVAFFQRLGPGLVNTAAILHLSNLLGTVEYGQFSLILATLSMMSTLCYGSIRFAIIPTYSNTIVNGTETVYKSSVLWLFLMTTAAAIPLVYFFHQIWPMTVLSILFVISFGLYCICFLYPSYASNE